MDTICYGQSSCTKCVFRILGEVGVELKSSILGMLTLYTLIVFRINAHI